MRAAPPWRTWNQGDLGAEYQAFSELAYRPNAALDIDRLLTFVPTGET